MKHVTVIINKSPLSSIMVSEVLRMSVGLIIMNNKVRLVFAADGVYSLGLVDHERIDGPEITKHLLTLQEFGCELIAEEDAVKLAALDKVSVPIQLKNKQEIAQMLTESDAVIGV